MIPCLTCFIEKEPEAFEFQYVGKNGRSLRRKTCRECRKAKARARYGRSGKGLREKYLKYSYNLTLEQYEEMSLKQEHKCAICKELPKLTKGKSVALVVDHDHETGKVRKLLCDPCNRGLGQFESRPEALLTAYDYIKEHK